MRKTTLLLAALVASPALAADHLDFPDATVDAAADITDLYAFTNSDASKINLILNVGPNGSATDFSTAVTYAFHVESTAAYGTAGTNTMVLCEFYDDTNLECWVVAADGTTAAYVTGDASAEAGISNASGSIKVFAGPRDDPFFMDLAGFNTAADAVAASPIAPAVDTCPTLDTATQGTLLTALTGGANFFAGHTVQSLVVQVDTALLNPGGALLAVHSSTHVKSSN